MQTLSNALLDVLEHLHRHGGALDWDAAMVLSGAAFRHYLFTTEDNHAWLVEHPGEHWREDSQRVENYGAFEALQGHTGWSGRRWEKLKGGELVQLLRYELADGRVARLEGVGFIIGVEASRQGIALTIDTGDDENPQTLAHSDFATIDEFSAALPTLWTLRKEPGTIPDTRRHALTGDVLRWAWTHYTSRKEIIHDVDAFYATGRRAWEKLIAMATDLCSPDTELNTEAADAFIRAHVRELAIARESAARFFGDAALVLDHCGNASVSGPALEALDRAFTEAAEALRAAEDVDAEGLADTLQRAATAEGRAFEALRDFAG